MRCAGAQRLVAAGFLLAQAPSWFFPGSHPCTRSRRLEQDRACSRRSGVRCCPWGAPPGLQAAAGPAGRGDTHTGSHVQGAWA